MATASQKVPILQLWSPALALLVGEVAHHSQFFSYLQWPFKPTWTLVKSFRWGARTCCILAAQHVKDWSYKFHTIFWQSLTFPFFRLIKGYSLINFEENYISFIEISFFSVKNPHQQLYYLQMYISTAHYTVTFDKKDHLWLQWIVILLKFKSGSNFHFSFLRRRKICILIPPPKNQTCYTIHKERYLF